MEEGGGGGGFEGGCVFVFVFVFGLNGGGIIVGGFMLVCADVVSISGSTHVLCLMLCADAIGKPTLLFWAMQSCGSISSRIGR